MASTSNVVRYIFAQFSPTITWWITVDPWRYPFRDNMVCVWREIAQWHTTLVRRGNLQKRPSSHFKPRTDMLRSVKSISGQGARETQRRTRPSSGNVHDVGDQLARESEGCFQVQFHEVIGSSHRRYEILSICIVALNGPCSPEPLQRVQVPRYSSQPLNSLPILSAPPRTLIAKR
jgi:hypothetical protein